MRAALAAALPGTAVVLTPTVVPDGGGGGTTTFVPAGTFAARLAPLASAAGEGEKAAGGMVQPITESVVTLPVSAQVGLSDRLSMGGRVYSVTAIRSRDWELSRRLEVKEII